MPAFSVAVVVVNVEDVAVAVDGGVPFVAAGVAFGAVSADGDTVVVVDGDAK